MPAKEEARRRRDGVRGAGMGRGKDKWPSTGLQLGGVLSARKDWKRGGSGGEAVPEPFLFQLRNSFYFRMNILSSGNGDVAQMPPGCSGNTTRGHKASRRGGGSVYPTAGSCRALVGQGTSRTWWTSSAKGERNSQLETFSWARAVFCWRTHNSTFGDNGAAFGEMLPNGPTPCGHKEGRERQGLMSPASTHVPGFGEGGCVLSCLFNLPGYVAT